MDAVELAGVELTRILIGDGPEAQSAGQALGQRRGIERLRRYGRHLGLARADRVGALERDGGEHHQHNEEGEENLFHGARSWRDGARPARGPRRTIYRLHSRARSSASIMATFATSGW